MIGVLVSGEGTNLQALVDAGLPVRAVASNRAGARALARAERAGIAAEVFELDAYGSRDAARRGHGRLARLAGSRPCCLCGLHASSDSRFLDRYPGRIVNVHPSLLPEFPGARAIDDALEAGVETTGVTVHLVDEGLDTGDVIRQEPLPVEPRDTLTERIQAIEHRLLPEVVRELCVR